MYNIYIFCLTTIKEMLSAKRNKNTIQYRPSCSPWSVSSCPSCFPLHYSSRYIFTPFKIHEKVLCRGLWRYLVWQPVEVIIYHFPTSSDPSWCANLAHQVCPSLWIKYSHSYHTSHICVMSDLWIKCVIVNLWIKYSHSYQTIHICVKLRLN